MDHHATLRPRVTARASYDHVLTVTKELLGGERCWMLSVTATKGEEGERAKCVRGSGTKLNTCITTQNITSADVAQEGRLLILLHSFALFRKGAKACGLEAAPGYQ